MRLREAFDAVDTTKSGSLSLNDLKMAFRIHVHRDLSSHDIKKISHYNHFNFNYFCCIVAEFKYSKKKHLNSVDEVTKLDQEKGKRQRFKHFLSRVFHHKSSSSSSSAPSSSGTNNLFTVEAEPEEEQQQLANIRDGGAISLLKSRRGSSVRDFYLGGSSNGSWRQDVAVPMLKKHGLTYFNPQAVTRRLMPMWASAIDNSRVLIFVIQGNR